MLKRYSKQILLPEIGIEGQKKLNESKVLIVGAGGLGSPAIIHLASAGIGTIGIADFDNVEESNLHRQILYSEKDIGKNKSEAASEAIKSINSNVKIKLHNFKITEKNSYDAVKEYDAVIECSDSMDSRYAVNDACLKLNIPFIYGSASKFSGYVSVFNHKAGNGRGPCMRCMLPEKNDFCSGCAEEGVLGTVPGIIGLIQATETIKIILGIGEVLSGRLLKYDALKMSFEEYKIRKNKDCLCNDIKNSNFINHENNKSKNNFNQNSNKDWKDEMEEEIDAAGLKSLKDSKKDFLLLDVREDYEYKKSSIKSAHFIPLSRMISGDLSFFDSIPKEKEIIIYCRSGGRSMTAIFMLRGLGYKNARSLRGGIKAWAKEADNSIVVE